MDQVKRFLTEKGLTPVDLPRGLVVHECLGVAVLVTAWVGCYYVRPSARIMAVLKQRNVDRWEGNYIVN